MHFLKSDENIKEGQLTFIRKESLNYSQGPSLNKINSKRTKTKKHICNSIIFKQKQAFFVVCSVLSKLRPRNLNTEDSWLCG